MIQRRTILLEGVVRPIDEKMQFPTPRDWVVERRVSFGAAAVRSVTICLRTAVEYLANHQTASGREAPNNGSE